jgi:hypothetical protein
MAERASGDRLDDRLEGDILPGGLPGGSGAPAFPAEGRIRLPRIPFTG